MTHIHPPKRVIPEKLKKDAHPLVNIAKMLAVLAMAVAVSELMYRLRLGNQNLIMIYLLAVFVVTFVTPTYLYGILTALLGTFIYDLLVTEPRMAFSFTIGLPITLFIMLTVTFVTSALIMQIKTQARIAVDREQLTQLLYEISQKLLAERDPDRIAAIALEHLAAYLESPVFLYSGDPLAGKPGEAFPDPGPVFGDKEQLKCVHRIFRLGAAEEERPYDDTSLEVYNVPVIAGEKVLAVIGVACPGHPLPGDADTFIRALAGQLALALELSFLSAQRGSMEVEAERERMRGTLLRSISHDLRTPLTSILGAGSAILEQKDMDPETLEKLAGDIKTDAQWLIRMVENILVITRISGDGLKVAKTPEAAEEVVSRAVGIIRGRFPDYMIHVQVPESLLMVPMDATLISQVLINLLENAVKNSPDGSLILLDLKKQGEFAEFSVSDNGTGIPEHLLDNLFELHPPERETAVDTSRGMGIGLSICKTIVQAHGGRITGINREKGGAKFTVSLPLREESGDD